MFEFENDLLVIDELIRDPGLSNSLVVHIGDDYYTIKSTVANITKKPIPSNALRPYKKRPNKEWTRGANFEIFMAGMIPRGGFDVSVKRAITPEEFEAICEEYNLTDSDISAEFVDTIGVIYGDDYAQKITSKQVQVPMSEAILIERRLQKMGVQANSTAPGRINIRTGHGGPRPGSGRPVAEDKKISRSIKFSDAEWDEVKRKAEAEGLTASEYARQKLLG